MEKTKCTILEVKKDDMRICSARVIFATLVDDGGNEHQVAWVAGWAVERTTGTVDYLETPEFKQAWNKAERGMQVELCYADESNRGYFLISDC